MGIIHWRRDSLPAVALPLLLAGFASGAVLPAAGAAQSLNPQMLRSLQSSLGVDDSLIESVVGQQESSQDSGEGAEPSFLSATGGRVDTSEEQELRRARARGELDRLYQPSEVERDYRRRLDEPDLRQFGYAFLLSARPPTGSRAGALGDDYVLGIGDEVQVALRGSVNRSQTIRINRNGQLVVSGLPPIDAAGRTVSSVRQELMDATGNVMLGTDAYLSVGSVRAISVFVGGEVERPGQFQLTSLSDVGTAIASAGGIRRTGSLRQVRVVRSNGSTVSVDLYGLLGIGTPPAVQLMDGDRVIVPVIGATVAVTGGVARPGIYELRGSQSLAEVVAYAGGAIRSRGARVSVGRIGAGGDEQVLALPLSAAAAAGDAVEVVSGASGGAAGRVRLAGNVDNPGARSLAGASTIAALVGPLTSLRDDTYRLAAVLVRHDAATGASEYRVVNLGRELSSAQSTPLASGDRLFLISNRDVDFLNQPTVRQIVLGEQQDAPVCRSLRSFAQLVAGTGNRRFNAVTRGGSDLARKTAIGRGRVGTMLEKGTPPSPAASAALLLEERPPEAGDVSPPVNGSTSRTRSDQAPDPQQQLEEARRRLCPDLFEEQPDLLPVLLEHSVSVGGAVRRPGAYPVGDDVSARDLALVAGGVVAGARDVAIEVGRGATAAGERLPASDERLAATRFLAGDDLRIDALLPEFEAAGVELAGEVLRPGYYSIRKGETLSDVLERAGGLTPYGYAYGTVFTRQSVKQQQEEGFRRTAFELNNSLIAIVARSGQGAASLSGASALISALSDVEASGRMVVEADPRVLRLRPDLDTVLEAGDRIFVPKRPNYVLALGDVNNPGALQFVPGKEASFYLQEAGGTLSTADRKRAFVVLPDGTAQPMGLASGGGVPPPGSTLIVPKNIDPLYKLTIIRDMTTIVAQLASSVATVAVLAIR